MEDLDIIRHDMQPGLQSPAEIRGRAARESRPRDLPRKSAADFRDLPRVHGRAAEYNL